VVVLTVAGIWAYLRYFEWRNLYHPGHGITSTPAELGLEYEDITFVSEDGLQLNGWWIPHAQARGTIIHCHGNAGNMSDRVWLVGDLHRLGVNVFIFDYRGYGNSRGLPTEQGTYADARAAYEVVRAKYDDVDTPPVIVHGQSLGGAVAVQLALDKPVKGLIVESAFPSTLEIGRRLYPWLPIGLFCRFKYDSLSKVGRIHAPKLFAHSRQDDLIPYDLGRRLYDVAAPPKEFCELHGGHNEAGWASDPEYWRKVEKLVTAVFGPPR